ncbi:hypothetical protein BVG81_008675 [Haliangium sp. UPWRP_2]|nr:hypothetical protein BVG81_008675 [Haliangium sp. UPWRP_2]
MRLRMAARRDPADESPPDPLASRSAKRAELLTAATGSGKAPRVALEQQVQSQAPPRAVRYRLVVGVEQKFQNVVIAPEDSAWNLMPFQAPDDLRLVSGHTYRIVWIDRAGNTVRPLEWAPTPSLHFFLGEPDAEISAQQVEHRHQTQLVMQLRQQVDQLQRQLAREKRKQKALKDKLRARGQRAREVIATLKFRHREESFKAVVEKWTPVVALAAGLYWLSKSHATADAADAKSADAETDREAAPSGAAREAPPSMQGAHPSPEAARPDHETEAPKPGQAASPDLRSLVLIHGPQVLRRMVNQLLERRALLHELFAKKPRHTGQAAKPADDHKTQESQRIEQSAGVATRPTDRNRSPESESGSASLGAMPVDAASDDMGRQLVTALTEDPAWMQALVSALLSGGATDSARGRKNPLHDVVANLDPTLRAELLDVVRATLQVSTSSTELN